MINVEPLMALVAQWRSDAARFRGMGFVEPARQVEALAGELERTLREWATAPLDLQTAEAESGYTYSALAKQLRRGTLKNVGREGAPRIRRCDLPVKGGSESVRNDDGEPDLAGEVMRRRLAG